HRDSPKSRHDVGPDRAVVVSVCGLVDVLALQNRVGDEKERLGVEIAPELSGDREPQNQNEREEKSCRAPFHALFPDGLCALLPTASRDMPYDGGRSSSLFKSGSSHEKARSCPRGRTRRLRSLPLTYQPKTPGLLRNRLLWTSKPALRSFPSTSLFS